MRIDPTEFRIPAGKPVKLENWPTDIERIYSSKKEYAQLLSEHVKQMSKLQEVLYGSGEYALLLIFQAMDAAGKDGAIRHVMSGVDPQGCEVYSFKEPSVEELKHDFLWRSTLRLPERGRIGIFNRSYYEEVLVVRVHPEYLQKQGLEIDPRDPDAIWQKRLRSIVEMENHLHRNKTRIIKFFLHLSPEEQARRFVKRIDEPKKNWKMNIADMKERVLWDQYMKAYEECLRATTTKNSPWYILPADDKKNARLIVSRIILDTLQNLKMNYPEPSDEQRVQLQAIREQLVQQSQEG